MVVGGQRVEAEGGRPPGVAREVGVRVRMTAEVHQWQMGSEPHAVRRRIA
jgi:hypothetical protein